MLGLSGLEPAAFHQGYVGALLLVALVLLIALRLRAELVALLVLVALDIPGVVTRDEALSGFSNSAVITIIGLYVLGAALERTGVAERLARLIVQLGRGSEARLVALVMGVAATMSLVMNNIAAGAVILPAVISAARHTGRSPSRLLLPLAFGASLGGMATIFTTANIIIGNLIRTDSRAGLTFLDFFPLGETLVIAGTAYMVLVGRRLLVASDPLEATGRGRALASVYGLQDRLWEVQITHGSPLNGQTLQTAQIGTRYGVAVLSIFHGQDAEITPAPDTPLRANDVLLVAGREDAVREIPGVTIGRQTRTAAYLSHPQVHLAEVVVAPRAEILGQSLKELAFRRRYGVTVIAVWREDRAYRTHVGELTLEAGDALLVVGPRDRIAQLCADPAMVPLTPVPAAGPAPRIARQPAALLITALVLGVSMSNQLPTSISVLLGVVLFVLTGCLTMDEAMASIEWKTIFVIAGMLPLSTAMQKTGLAATLGTVLVEAIGGHGIVLLGVGLFIGTMVLSQIIGGQVAALVMGPIAIAAAEATGASPRSIGIVVAIACSASFLTPLAHPVNLLVAAPGGYTFGTFARVGSGLVVVCVAVIAAFLALGLVPS